jgi:Ras association (RalGDS/AF-6) domain
MDFGDAAAQNRRSDANLDDEGVHELQHRFSDYQYVPEWSVGRNSTAVIFENVDVRISGYSDQVVRRQSMASFRSDDRVSVIQRNAVQYEDSRSSFITEEDDLAPSFTSASDGPETPKPATQEMKFPTLSTPSTPSTPTASGESEPSESSIGERKPPSPPTLLGPDRPEIQQPSAKAADVQALTVSPTTDKKDTPSQGLHPVMSDYQPAASGRGIQSKASAEPPSVEIFKSFRVSVEDPCYRVIPAALKKYGISADPKEYSMYIVYGDQERCVGMHEKPLALFKQLDKEGRKPMFMLRRVLTLIGNMYQTRAMLASLKVTPETPCREVLPAAARKCGLRDDWRQYALCVFLGDQERRIGLDEKPLKLLNELNVQGMWPIFMLRNLSLASSISNTLPPIPLRMVARGAFVAGAAVPAIANRPLSSTDNPTDADSGFSSTPKSTRALVEMDKKPPSPSNADADVPPPFSAVSLFEFIVDTTKTEAGFPYLTYLPGEVFEIIAERGELWLARSQMDLIGWIWKKHFSRLPNFDSAIIPPGEAVSNKSRDRGASNAPKPGMVEVVAARTEPEGHNHSVTTSRVARVPPEIKVLGLAE